MTTCKIQCHLKYKIVQATEFVFLIQVAHHPDQTIIEEQLTFNPPIAWREFQDSSHQNRHIRLHVEPCDHFEVNYSATVERHPAINVDLQQNLNEVVILIQTCWSTWRTGHLPGCSRAILESKPLNNGFITIFFMFLAARINLLQRQMYSSSGRGCAVTMPIWALRCAVL